MNRYKVVLMSGTSICLFADSYASVLHGEAVRVVFQKNQRVVLNVDKDNIHKITLW
jgi:hypothetical protein